MKNLSITQNGWTESHVKLNRIFESGFGVEVIVTGQNSHDRSFCFTGHVDGSVYEWFTTPNRRPILRHEYEGKVASLSISPGNEFLATCGNDREIKLESLSPIQSRTITFKPHVLRVRCVRFLPAQDYLATCGDDKTVKLWKRSPGSVSFTRTFHGHLNWVRCIDVDQNNLLSCGDDGRTNIWDVETGQMTQRFEEPSTQHHGCCFLPESRVASCGRNGVIYVWDRRDGRLVQHYGAHTGAINSIAVSGGGNMLVSCAVDGTIRICNLNEGRLIWTISGSCGIFNCAHFDKSDTDRKTLISGDTDGVIAFWDIQT